MATREEALLRAITENGVETLELEWRLGHHGPHGFRPGLPEDAWTKLWHALNATGKRFRDTTVSERVISGTKLVTSGTQAFWKHKTRLFDFEQPPRIRISGSTENMQPIPEGTPLPAGGGYTRHKQRRSYEHGCWTIDLTKVATTADIDCDKYTYEVEIELANTEELFLRPVESVYEWGDELANDMLELAGM